MLVTKMVSWRFSWATGFPPTASEIAWIWSGVVPQQPPIKAIPTARKRRAYSRHIRWAGQIDIAPFDDLRETGIGLTGKTNSGHPGHPLHYLEQYCGPIQRFVPFHRLRHRAARAQPLPAYHRRGFSLFGECHLHPHRSTGFACGLLRPFQRDHGFFQGGKGFADKVNPAGNQSGGLFAKDVPRSINGYFTDGR